MNMSLLTPEIASALCKAQGERNWQAESDLLYRLRQRFHANQNDRKSPLCRFFEKIVCSVSDCWYWNGARHHLGYGLFASMGESKAHRVAWRLFNGDIPDGMNVLHRCDIRCCVNPEHLFLGTQADNVADMVQKGRQRTVPQPGEKNAMARLTAEQVKEMRRLYAQGGMTQKAIGKLFGVSPMTASRAIRGESWSHIDV